MFSPRRTRKSETSEIACIFVHAGAGFHSVQNEHVHLDACNTLVTPPKFMSTRC
jgi:taspase, threonine aspartase, 1